MIFKNKQQADKQPTKLQETKPTAIPPSKKPSLWEVFLLFSKIGLFTFGGGLAMLPLVQKAVVNQKHWMKDEDFIDMLVITNSAPGAFAINTAIFIGYKQRKLSGAIVGAMGTILPSFTVIIIIAYLLIFGNDISWLEKFFMGVRPVVVALILDAGIKLGLKTIKTSFDIILLITGSVLIIFTGIHPALIILAGAIIGLLYFRNQTEANPDSASKNKGVS